ncbi:TadE/TadG family type IV pilus assembly protein [Sedimentitalea nanhaiensis]|uniref:TadE-like protein n=1 Tax=Sedimentitalea nanhaiensis TaxID=999627 RepID=A0A1I6YGI5_9RHOB|nr:TadE family protein [Sedimentitalea nanhaiensis]SFT49623.1 TadE-like protein [Sedimentitalea nanhaiensis]
MIRSFLQPARRFLRREDGVATLEFVLTFPAMLMIMLSSIEVGMMTLNHSGLERAMDLTVRDIRLSTGTAPQYDEIKNRICQRAGFIKDCGNNLKLEMVQVDPRDWVGVSREVTCTDASKEVQPKTMFKNDAKDNELMILRACAKIKPIFPTTGLGKSIKKDGAGQYALVSTSVFVQEPR